MEIKLELDCVNCGETITKGIESFGNEISVHLMCFEQSEWDCKKCGHQTVTADMDMIDAEDL